MSYSDGWAAINLEMPARVPHSEYGLTGHWGIIKEVTGLTADANSPHSVKEQAAVALIRAINFDFRPNTLLGVQPFGDMRTRLKNDGAGDASLVIDSPFHQPEEVLHFNFQRKFGEPDRADWTAKFTDDYRQRSQETPDTVNTTGIYSGLITGMLEIFGWEMLLLAAGTDLEAFGELANRYAAWIRPYFEALANADIPLVLVHDDLAWTEGPIFAPAWYSRFLFPNYKNLFSPLLEAKKKILFSTAGNFTRFAPNLVECGVHGFLLDPSADLAALAEQYGQTHVLIGNANPRLLFSGNYNDIRAEIERCMQIGKRCPGFLIALGSEAPVNAPVENVLYYLDTYEALSKR